eukprot:jgi/Picsp_1/6830/NSC_04168-R2_dna repair endonuclease xpf-like
MPKMSDEGISTAFESHFLGSKESKITSSSIVDGGSRIYLGLEGGVLEECSVKTVEGSDVCSTVACKPLFTQQHSIVKILPVLSGNCICVITSDSCLRFVHPDSFESKVMHKGPIVSAAVSDSPVPAVAVARIGGISQSIRIGVYHIFPKEGSISDWRILWEVKLEVSGFDQYASLAFLNAPFCVLYKHGTRIILARTEPNKKHPIVESIYRCESKNRLDRVLGVPSMNCGVMLVGLLGIVLNDKGEPRGDSIRLDRLGGHTIDSAVVGKKLLVLNGRGIHVLGFQGGMTEQFVEIDAFGSNRDPEDSSWTLTPEYTIDGTSAIVTKNSSMWLISPQSTRKQVQQAIESHDLETAYRLIQEVNGLGEWHLQCLMECGSKFLRDGNIHRGIECLEKCPFDLFQPYNIFLLFPKHMGTYIQEKNLTFLPECNSFVAFDKDGQRAEAGSKDREQILDYLFRMREFPGVLNKDGIDALIFHLLIDSDRQDMAIAFSTISNDAVPDLVIDRLKEKGWFQCLAQILSKKPGHSHDAIYCWKQAIGNLTSVTDESGTLDGLKRLLVSKHLTTTAQVLDTLKWLIILDSNAALDVIKNRPDLSPDAILEMCPEGDFRWQYLQLAIQTDTNRQNKFMHTELSKSLAISIEREIEICIDKEHHVDDTQTPLQYSVADEAQDDDSPSSFIAHVFDHASAKLLHEDFVRLKELRSMLRCHIIQSPCIDLEAVKQYIVKLPVLKEEVAIIACIQGEYKKMITMLVEDLDGSSVAIQFAKRYLNQKDHLELLDLLLKQVQTQGRGNWEVVGHFMASLGHSVDIENIIESVPGGTNLADMDMLLPIIFRHTIHSKRQGEIVKSLHLSRLRSLMEQVQQLKAKKIIVDDTVCCSVCHLRVGQKVFVLKRYSNEANTQAPIICLKCYKDSL